MEERYAQMEATLQELQQHRIKSYNAISKSNKESYIQSICVPIAGRELRCKSVPT